jgi:hypothetical protein
MTLVAGEPPTLTPSNDALIEDMQRFHEFHTMMNRLACLMSLFGAFDRKFVFFDNPDRKVK